MFSFQTKFRNFVVFRRIFSRSQISRYEKGDESTTPKEASKEVEVDITTPVTENHHTSSDILQVISSMRANLDQTNQILATLMAERKRPLT